MTARDVDLLQHRLDAATRAATRIRQHLHDLHAPAWERTVIDAVKVQETRVDHSPKAGDLRARRLWERATAEIGRVEDILVGLERQVIGYFMVNSSPAEPSRGSLIPAVEHDRLLASQRARAAAGEYVPVRLVDQPPHPGKGRK